MVLILKVEQACRMKELRPIDFYNVLYKIIAMVLSKILKFLLPGLISETQSAFVVGKSITYNVVLAIELIQQLKRKGELKRGMWH